MKFNWIKLAIFNKALFKESVFRGEWWIINNGKAEFADATVGDMDHEQHVIDYIRNQYAGEKDWDEFELEILNQKLKKDGQKPLTKMQMLMRRQELDPIIAQELMTMGMSPQEIKIARQQVEKIDIRSFAMENYGWKSVKTNYIQTWNLTEEDLNCISRGIFDADSEIDDSEEFNIEVMSSNKTFAQVPLYVIRSRDPRELFNYEMNLNYR